LAKRFDPELHELYDRKAKGTLIDYLTSKGVQVIEEPFGRYGVDLKAVDTEGNVIYFDVEVRPIWSGGEFPFPSVHLPHRKKKFLNLDHPTYFVSFRKDCKAGMVFTVSNGTGVENVPNCYMQGENFYSVPLSECKYFDVYSGSF
jgi:hypothetical protein